MAICPLLSCFFTLDKGAGVRYDDGMMIRSNPMRPEGGEICIGGSSGQIAQRGQTPLNQEEILMAGKTVTPKEIAHEWGISPKTLRKFLRQDKGENGLASLAPGKGGRWALPAGRVKTARKRFDLWKAEEARKRAEALATRNATEAPEGDDEVEETESPETEEALEGDEVTEEDEEDEALIDE